jgi:hypothetical protein
MTLESEFGGTLMNAEGRGGTRLISFLITYFPCTPIRKNYDTENQMTEPNKVQISSGNAAPPVESKKPSIKSYPKKTEKEKNKKDPRFIYPKEYGPRQNSNKNRSKTSKIKEEEDEYYEYDEEDDDDDDYYDDSQYDENDDAASTITALTAAAATAAIASRRSTSKGSNLVAIGISVAAIAAILYVAYRTFTKFKEVSNELDKLKNGAESETFTAEEAVKMCRKEIKKLLDEPISINIPNSSRSTQIAEQVAPRFINPGVAGGAQIPEGDAQIGFANAQIPEGDAQIGFANAHIREADAKDLQTQSDKKVREPEHKPSEVVVVVVAEPKPELPPIVEELDAIEEPEEPEISIDDI